MIGSTHRLLFVSSALLVSAGGSAVCQDRVSALDVALAPAAFENKRVLVEGCKILGASLDLMLCSIETKTGNVGTIEVNADKLNIADRKRALEECADFSPLEQCEVEVLGDVDRANDGSAVIVAADYNWRSD
ncbi:MAG: hypothetical protein C0606_11115 [Hyphomicrobiales bacterium]|nr:MAG: hypothetical protein C0606_11115 [Hyphomicrobiales bacterium]